MYSKILVPVSFDDDAKIRAAVQAATALTVPGGEVAVLHVYEPVPPYALRYMPDDLVRATEEGILAELERLSENLAGAYGVLVEGHAGRAILDYAAANGVDCIILASHRPGMQDYLLGSTAAQVVRHAACTVMVIR